uniref:Uncharacterized protein n=1 Tax=Plectus sambesii TaxID=2011161 RepID=A0A914WGH5_9BILA
MGLSPADADVSARATTGQRIGGRRVGESIIHRRFVIVETPVRRSRSRRHNCFTDLGIRVRASLGVFIQDTIKMSSAPLSGGGLSRALYPSEMRLSYYRSINGSLRHPDVAALPEGTLLAHRCLSTQPRP